MLSRNVEYTARAKQQYVVDTEYRHDRSVSALFAMGVGRKWVLDDVRTKDDMSLLSCLRYDVHVYQALDIISQQAC